MMASTLPPLNDSHADEADTTAGGWSKRTRIIASLLVVGHLLAVAVPPLAFQAVGPLGLSPAVETVLLPVEYYSQMLYMDRGYAFFAPDPGPSHLIQAGLTDGSGKLTEKMYPDREQHWPRLLYHRHFMLSEFLNDIHQPPGPPPELIEEDPETAASWRDLRARYEHVRRSMSEHLEYAHPGNSVLIRRVEHLIPGVLEFQDQPIALTDQRLYEVLLDQPIALQSEGDLVAPERPPEAVPVPDDEQAEAQTTEPASEPRNEPSNVDLPDREDSKSSGGENPTTQPATKGSDEDFDTESKS